jgi:hypothetical protein
MPKIRLWYLLHFSAGLNRHWNSSNQLPRLLQLLTTELQQNWRMLLLTEPNIYFKRSETLCALIINEKDLQIIKHRRIEDRILMTIFIFWTWKFDDCLRWSFPPDGVTTSETDHCFSCQYFISFLTRWIFQDLQTGINHQTGEMCQKPFPDSSRCS